NSRGLISPEHPKTLQGPRHKRYRRRQLLDDPRVQLPRKRNPTVRPEGSSGGQAKSLRIRHP
ncbi:hypothetical protein A2U01_0106062, partial [Trifolium medium]|nr:hypothetical protein [Trifolium medium]